MKKYFKYLLLIILLFQVNLVKAKPANEAFDDDNFYKCVVDAYNKEHPNDTKQYTDSLSDTELEGIKKLTCTNKGVKSANGVEKLTQLTDLNLGINKSHITYGVTNENKISSINLENNTLLKNLDVTGNSLKELNLEKNVNLESLHAGLNSFTTLNLEKNTKLETLNIGCGSSEGYVMPNDFDTFPQFLISCNTLTNIDLTNNKELQFLIIQGGQFENIDLSQNTKLSRLVLANNSKIKNVNLEQNVDLYEVRMYNLNLSNVNLNNNQHLKTLQLEENKINNIDLSKNTDLKELYLSSNELNSIELTNNSKLETVAINRNKLDKIDVKANSLLKYLYLSSNNLSEIDVRANTQLTTLDVSNNNLSEIDVSKNIQLTNLDLRNNNLNGIDVSMLTQLTYLILSDNNLSGIDVKGNTELTNLYLTNNNISEVDITKTTLLKTLKLENNELLSLNVNGLKNLVVTGSDSLVSHFSPQAREITLKKKNGLYTLNLKEYDKKIDISKVDKLKLPEYMKYDSNTGLITFNSFNKEDNKITYSYKTGKDLDMEVTLTLLDGGEEVEPPKEEVKPNTTENKPQDVPEDADKPLDKSPQTGGYLVGSLILVGLVTGLYYKYYLTRKNKINKI